MRTLRKYLIVLWLALIIAPMVAPTYAQPVSSVDTKRIDATITRLMDMYHIPGVAIAIVQNDKVFYANGYGLRNVEGKQPVTENTVFGIGSITKSFTVLGIIKLVDEGKIDLDAPVITYLPDFKLADSDATKTVTVRQVISHTSGLPRADERWLNKPPVSRQAALDDTATIKLTAKPGKKWQYSNQNFAIAAAIIEKITGQTWEQYTQRLVFDALGMKSATFSVAAMQKGRDYAISYHPDILKDFAAVSFSDTQFKAMQGLGPAGEINASVLDMAQYIRFQLGDGTFAGEKIISKKLMEVMHTQQIAVPELNGGLAYTTKNGYGLAWVTQDYQGHRVVQHDGLIAGYAASLTLLPDDNLGFVLLSNVSTASLFLEIARLTITADLLGVKLDKDIADQVNAIIRFDPEQWEKDVAAAKAYKADPTALKKLEGTYTILGATGDTQLVLQEGMLHLLIEKPIKQDVLLVPLADNKFLMNGTMQPPLNMAFDTDGTVVVFQSGIPVGRRTK
jgi:CubicO group peptidase (beta-lactamase class C family)